jgi:nicotinate-nucleotide--dimethylbenzimidazole phosphoribosyltransferase
MILPIDPANLKLAEPRQNQLLKIPGSLGLLEEIGNRVGAIQGTDRPRLEKGAVVVCCGDHGVVAESVAAFPDSITRIQAMNFLEGGAAINQIALAAGADLWVVDAGTKGDTLPSHPRLVGPRIRSGAGNIAREPAMTREEAQAAIDLGRKAARRALDAGAQVLAAGDMGIGNTTPSSALTAAYLGLEPDLVTGRGSGLDEAARAKKAAIVALAIARACQTLGPLEKADPLDVLAHLGGLEIAAIAGVYLEGATRGVPLVCDGFPVTAGALAAARIDPMVKAYLFAGHLSAEPGHAWQLRDLNLEPVFKLGLRLGEGTGAVLAFPVMRAACQILAGMKTFADVGM